MCLRRFEACTPSWMHDLIAWYWRWAERRKRRRLVYVPVRLVLTVADDRAEPPSTA